MLSKHPSRNEARRCSLFFVAVVCQFCAGCGSKPLANAPLPEGSRVVEGRVAIAGAEKRQAFKVGDEITVHGSFNLATGARMAPREVMIHLVSYRADGRRVIENEAFAASERNSQRIEFHGSLKIPQVRGQNEMEVTLGAKEKIASIPVQVE